LEATQGGDSVGLMIVEACFLVVAVTITVKAYSGDTT
jgi:hypothetical protein